MAFQGIILSLVWSIILLAIILRASIVRDSSIQSPTVTLAFLLKIIGTFLLQIMFTFHYEDRSTADIFRFFDDGLILFELFKTDSSMYVQALTGFYEETSFQSFFEKFNAWNKPFESGLYNDNHTMIRINSLLNFVSGGHFEIHGILFSSLAFLATISLVRTFASRQENLALLLISFYPSYLIWLSGGLKETLTIIGLGLFFIPAINGLKFQEKWGYALCGLFLLSIVKIYILAALLPAVLILILIRRNVITANSSYFVIALMLLAGLAISSFFQLNLLDEIVHKQHDFLSHSAATNPGSWFEIEPLKQSWIAILRAVPMALSNVLFRPWFWEFQTAAELLMTVENTLVFSLFWYVVLKHKTKLNKVHVNFIIQFGLPLIILIGLTTPVFGAIMRYRAPIFLFMLLILINALPIKNFKH